MDIELSGWVMAANDDDSRRLVVYDEEKNLVLSRLPRLEGIFNEGAQEMRVWDPAGTSRLAVVWYNRTSCTSASRTDGSRLAVVSRTDGFCVDHQGNDETVHPRSKR